MVLDDSAYSVEMSSVFHCKIGRSPSLKTLCLIFISHDISVIWHKVQMIFIFTWNKPYLCNRKQNDNNNDYDEKDWRDIADKEGGHKNSSQGKHPLANAQGHVCVHDVQVLGETIDDATWGAMIIPWEREMKRWTHRYSYIKGEGHFQVTYFPPDRLLQCEGKYTGKVLLRQNYLCRSAYLYSCHALGIVALTLDA